MSSLCRRKLRVSIFMVPTAQIVESAAMVLA